MKLQTTSVATWITVLTVCGRSLDSRACVLMLIRDSTISNGKSYAIFHTYTLFINSFCVRYEAPKNINTRMGHMDQLSTSPDAWEIEVMHVSRC